MAVLQDRSEAREEVADGGLHPLRHGSGVDAAAAAAAVDDGDDGPQGAQDGSQDVRELFSQVLEEDDAQVGEELVVSA